MNISELPYSFVLKCFILIYVKDDYTILWVCNKDMNPCFLRVCRREKSETSGSSLLSDTNGQLYTCTQRWSEHQQH